MMMLQQFGSGGGGGFISALGAIPIVGSLISGLASLFGIGGGGAVGKLAQWSSGVFEAVGGWISSIAHWVLNGLTRIAKFIAVTIKHFYKGVFARIFRLLDHVHQFLETHLRPIVNFIKRVRAWYDRMFKLYVKPFLNMLQHVRQVLGVLRALHIHIADSLDRRILQIEAGVGGLFNQVRTVLNGFIDIFNTVIDPRSMIRRPILVYSIRRTINAMLRVGTGMPPGFFFPSPRKHAGAGLGFLPANFVAGDATMNPPASSFLGSDDGIGTFSGFLPGDIPQDSAVDDLDTLDYFDDALYPAPACTDVASCLARSFEQATTKDLTTSG